MARLIPPPGQASNIVAFILLLSFSMASVEWIPIGINPSVAYKDKYVGARTRIEMSRWWMDTSLQSISIVYPHKGINWGLNWTHLGDNQGVDWTDTTGASNGTIYYGESQLAFSVGMTAGMDDWALTVRDMTQKAVGDHHWLAADVGWQREILANLRAGILIKNIVGTFTQMDTKGYTEIGSIYRWGPVDLAIDYSTRFSGWRGGVGWKLGPIQLVGGLDEDRTLSAGCALEADPIRVDYTWKTIEGMGTLHRIAMEILWP